MTANAKIASRTAESGRYRTQQPRTAATHCPELARTKLVKVGTGGNPVDNDITVNAIPAPTEEEAATLVTNMRRKKHPFQGLTVPVVMYPFGEVVRLSEFLEDRRLDQGS